MTTGEMNVYHDLNRRIYELKKDCRLLRRINTELLRTNKELKENIKKLNEEVKNLKMTAV